MNQNNEAEKEAFESDLAAIAKDLDFTLRQNVESQYSFFVRSYGPFIQRLVAEAQARAHQSQPTTAPQGREYKYACSLLKQLAPHITPLPQTLDVLTQIDNGIAGLIDRTQASGATQDVACKNCKGEGWVCENHEDTPWHEHGDCGAGSPCPVCNRRMACEPYMQPTTAPQEPSDSRYVQLGEILVELSSGPKSMHELHLKYKHSPALYSWALRMFAPMIEEADGIISLRQHQPQKAAPQDVAAWRGFAEGKKLVIEQLEAKLRASAPKDVVEYVKMRLAQIASGDYKVCGFTAEQVAADAIAALQNTAPVAGVQGGVVNALWRAAFDAALFINSLTENRDCPKRVRELAGRAADELIAAIPHASALESLSAMPHHEEITQLKQDCADYLSRINVMTQQHEEQRKLMLDEIGRLRAELAAQRAVTEGEVVEEIRIAITGTAACKDVKNDSWLLNPTNASTKAARALITAGIVKVKASNGEQFNSVEE